MNEEGRFWSKVDILSTPSGCWRWRDGLSSRGYGRFWVSGHQVYAHRVAYEYTNGQIPPTLQIDHLCRNRACVNPAHLEAVTQRENLLRGDAGAWQTAKTHCPQGHPYIGENLIVSSGPRRAPFRMCRACTNTRSRDYHARKRLFVVSQKLFDEVGA